MMAQVVLMILIFNFICASGKYHQHHLDLHGDQPKVEIEEKKSPEEDWAWEKEKWRIIHGVQMRNAITSRFKDEAWQGIELKKIVLEQMKLRLDVLKVIIHDGKLSSFSESDLNVILKIINAVMDQR